uniref:Uncharacterized protein n=1 Tax=Glossina austeni TaxID=7395 RepID=A0A1A9VPS7_GLOAU
MYKHGCVLQKNEKKKTEKKYYVQDKWTQRKRKCLLHMWDLDSGDVKFLCQVIQKVELKLNTTTTTSYCSENARNDNVQRLTLSLALYELRDEHVFPLPDWVVNVLKCSYHFP